MHTHTHTFTHTLLTPFQAAMAADKQAEKDRPLPPGWRRVESRSRPGEYVYENIHTEERQAWFPEVAAAEEAAPPLVAQSESDRKKEELKAKNIAALQKRKELAEQRKAAEAQMELPPRLEADGVAVAPW